MMCRKLRMLKIAVLTIGCGVLFDSMGCVTRATEVVGSGLTFGGITGLLGPASLSALQVGAGIDFFSNLIRFAR